MVKPRGPRPAALVLSAAEQQALQALLAQHSAPQQLALRARLVLAAGTGLNNGQVARQLQVTPTTVRLWRARWRQQQEVPLAERGVAARLTDAPRPGAPARITPEQWVQVMSLVCAPPGEAERPISQWSAREIAAEAIHRGIVDRLSPRHVARFLKGGGTTAAPEPLLAPRVP